MPISKLRPSFTLTEDRLRELQAVVPEAFADGRINWGTLKEALGETLEDEDKEHFGLFWPGKREARRLAAMPSKGTLIPQPGTGVDEDSTHNLFIEGDNLEVLKLLKKLTQTGLKLFILTHLTIRVKILYMRIILQNRWKSICVNLAKSMMKELY
jgi:adenine-specific DNA-methyltransferase